MEDAKRTERSNKLATLAGKERTLQLAGTMSLVNRKMDPIDKLRETRGIVTIKRVPDVFESKNMLAQKLSKQGMRGEYSPPKKPEFKNYDTLRFNQKDFDNLSKQPEIENKHGLSAFEQIPKEFVERDQKRAEKQKEAEGLVGKASWVSNHHVPMKHIPITQTLKDKYAKGVKKESTQNLEQDTWESAYTLLARTINDEVVVGKPAFNPYIKAIRPEDKNRDFLGQPSQLKQIA